MSRIRVVTSAISRKDSPVNGRTYKRRVSVRCYFTGRRAGSTGPYLNMVEHYVAVAPTLDEAKFKAREAAEADGWEIKSIRNAVPA